MIIDIILEFKKIISLKEQAWIQHKVRRDLSDIDILEDVKLILEERCIDTDEIEELIGYLKCESTIKENHESVEKFKNAIKRVIPEICDAMDDYNHDEIYDIVRDILYPRPKAHQMLHYQLEKIYCCLNNNHSDTEWGLIQAEEFSKEFAKKWVIIKPRDMSFDEIKLLTRVACYLEYKEQIGEEV